jgi:hypothetical protein
MDSSAPVLNLEMLNGTQIKPIDTTFVPISPPPPIVTLTPDTKVSDGTNTGTLGDVFKVGAPTGASSTGVLCLDIHAQFIDNSDPNQVVVGAFNFEWDSVGNDWGAGTAFLQDTSTTT